MSSQINDSKDAGHYVVTAHRPGAVLASCIATFLSSESTVRLCPLLKRKN